MIFLIAMFALACMVMAAGCVTTNVGDGKVDAVESATIRLAVGAAMSAKPETIIPAYAVTKTLLTIMDGSEAVRVADLDAALAERINTLDLTPYEKQSVSDLAALVRANIQERIAGIPQDRMLVVVRAVIEIVHDSAAARLHPGGVGP